MSHRHDPFRRQPPLAPTPASPPAQPLIGWHEGARAVMFFNAPPKPGIGYPSQLLRDTGWAADDADFRRTLPRVDPSPLAAPTPFRSEFK